MLGVAIGWPLGLPCSAASSLDWFSGDGLNVIVGSVLIALLLTFVLYQFFEAKARQIEAERRATEGQLRLLQAQIEPHFLFNTLANVLSLIEPRSGPRPGRMLESFTDYLRSSLGQPAPRRRARWRTSWQLAQAYLRVLQLRMEDRLRFAIEADRRPRAARAAAAAAAAAGRERDPCTAWSPRSTAARSGSARTVQAGAAAPEVEDDGLGLDGPRAPPRPPRRQRHGADQHPQPPAVALRHGRATLRLEAIEPGHAGSAGAAARRSPPTPVAEPHANRPDRRRRTAPCPHLREQLAALWPELQIVAPGAQRRRGRRARSQRCSPTWPSSTSRCPGLTGLEVAQGIEGRTRVVFVTAYDEYARAGLRAGRARLRAQAGERASAWPRTVARLQRALAPACRHRRHPAGRRCSACCLGRQQRGTTLRWVRASAGDLTHQVTVDEVLFFRADDKYTCVQTATRRAPDPHADRRAGAAARTGAVRAGASLDHRQPRSTWPARGATKPAGCSCALRGRAQELPVSRAYVPSVQGDVRQQRPKTATTGPTPSVLP